MNISSFEYLGILDVYIIDVLDHKDAIDLIVVTYFLILLFKRIIIIYLMDYFYLMYE